VPLRSLACAAGAHDGPSSGVTDGLDAAKAAFRRAWANHALPPLNPAGYYIDSMKPIICGAFTISDVGSRLSALIRREG
jgi:hypothetical protein